MHGSYPVLLGRLVWPKYGEAAVHHRHGPIATQPPLGSVQRRHFTIVIAVRRRLPLPRRAGLAVAGPSSGAEEELADGGCNLRLWRRHAVEELRDG